MNAQLRRIQDTLRKEVPDVSPEVDNEVQWKVWWALFKNKADDVTDDQLLPGRNYRTTYRDSYTQV